VTTFDLSEERLTRIGIRAMVASVASAVVGTFFVAYFGGLLAALMAVVMAASIAGSTLIVGAAVALRSTIQRAKRELS